MASHDKLRKQIASLLSWSDAHVDFDAAVKGIPERLRGMKPRGLPYSLWQLLEHLRLAQRDIVDFCTDPNYEAPAWPDDYWPRAAKPPTAAAWQKSVAAVRADRRRMERLLADPSLDLFARIPHGDGQTYLREFLLAADHNAFHIGEIVIVRRLLGAWNQPA